MSQGDVTNLRNSVLFAINQRRSISDTIAAYQQRIRHIVPPTEASTYLYQQLDKLRYNNNSYITRFQELANVPDVSAFGWWMSNTDRDQLFNYPTTELQALYTEFVKIMAVEDPQVTKAMVEMMIQDWVTKMEKHVKSMETRCVISERNTIDKVRKMEQRLKQLEDNINNLIKNEAQTTVTKFDQLNETLDNLTARVCTLEQNSVPPYNLRPRTKRAKNSEVN